MTVLGSAGADANGAEAAPAGLGGAVTTGTGTAVVAAVGVLESAALQSGNVTEVHAVSRAKLANMVSWAANLKIFRSLRLKLRTDLPVFNTVRVWVVVIFVPLS